MHEATGWENEILKIYSQENMSILQYSTQAKKMPGLWEEIYKSWEKQPLLESLQEPQNSTPRETQTDRQTAVQETQ